jgi:hypothetical protein
MKKLSILLIGLLLVSGLAFADFGTVAVTGSASVTWGIDLDTNATGFKNAGTSSVSLTLIDKASKETGGDDGLYGYIKVKDYSLKVTDGAFVSSIGSVSASIFVDPAEIVIYTAPGMTWGSATVLETGDADVKPALAGANTIGGITIKLADLGGMADVSVYVVSDGDWTSNVANDYAAGTDLSVEVSVLTISVGGFYGWFNAAATWGGTAKTVVALDALNGVTITVGADFVEGVTWEVAAGAVINLTEKNADDKMGNVAVNMFYSTAADLDVTLGVTEPTAGGFVDMLGATVKVQLFDLTSGTIVWNVDVTGEYATGDVTPYFGFGYGSDTIFNLNAGVKLLAGLTGIDNTTITLDYVSTDLATDNGIITVMAAVKL